MSCSAKRTVDGIPTIAIRALLERQVMIPGRWISGGDFVTEPWCSHLALCIRPTADLRDPENAWIDLSYQLQSEPIRLRIQLTTTRPRYGGYRWWFRCPLRRGADGAGLRAEKLYLPPGALCFGSRLAHNLTYRSCQESRQFDVIDQIVANRLGTDLKTIRWILRRGR